MKQKKYPMIGIIIILAFWVLGHFFIDDQVIPNPLDVFIETVTLLMTRSFWHHIFASVGRLMISLAIATLLGGISGILIGMNKKLDKVCSPILYVIYPVPKVSFIPVLFILFGLSDTTRIVLIFSILYFQIALSVYEAIKNMDEALMVSALSIGLKGRQLYHHVIIPYIMPNILTSIRIGIGIAIAVLFFVETYATRFGLGYYIMLQWSRLDYPLMYGGILVLGIIGYCLFQIIDLIEDRWMQWK